MKCTIPFKITKYEKDTHNKQRVYRVEKMLDEEVTKYFAEWEEKIPKQDDSSGLKVEIVSEAELAERAAIKEQEFSKPKEVTKCLKVTVVRVEKDEQQE